MTHKKSTPNNYVSYDGVLHELLCFGWIDVIHSKLDSIKTMQIISLSKAEHWARTYKNRAVKLSRDFKMQDAGFKSIEASKTNGLWTLMDDVGKHAHS